MVTMPFQSTIRTKCVHENANVRETENEKRNQSDEQNIEDRNVSAKETFVFATGNTNED